MRRELYIDVLFLVNFTMDVLVLFLAKSLFGKRMIGGNIFLGAFFGALITCVGYMIPTPWLWGKMLGLHLGNGLLLAKIGLRPKGVRELIQAVLLLYGAGWLIGGILVCFMPYVTAGSLFFVLALAGYYVAWGIEKLIKAVVGLRFTARHVILECKDKQVMISAMVDTGNGLYDPYTGKPVSVLEECVFQKLLRNEEKAGICYIPFRSLGNSHGLLKTVTLDKMYIQGKQDCVIQKPVVGLWNESLSTSGEYHMLLHPDIVS